MEYIANCLECGKRNIKATKKKIQAKSRRCVQTMPCSTCHQLTRQRIVGKITAIFAKRSAFRIRFF